MAAVESWSMTCEKISSPVATDLPPPVLVVGYGNVHRRDDGVGAHVADCLRTMLPNDGNVRVLGKSRLDPALVEEMQGASSVVFVDAAARPVPGGWAWSKLQPDLARMHYLTHQWDPACLLGLLRWLYRSAPPAWVISIQGEDFGFGEGLTPPCAGRAAAVSLALSRCLQLTRRSGKAAQGSRGAAG
jgi:hydrogenase maturation protease